MKMRKIDEKSSNPVESRGNVIAVDNICTNTS